MTKKSTILLCLAALLLTGSAALWLSGLFQVSGLKPPVSRSMPPATGIVTTALNSHLPVASYSKTGDVIPLPANPALADALSHTSRLDYSLRLKTVHSLQGSVLPADQADFLRAFVADSTIPEGLNIRQVRALKNDVLNVLGVQPGGDAATAVMLRVLYADESADPGLRDYALQHLANLIERDPRLGWSSHLHAIESNNPALAATALIHLAAQLRAQASSFKSQASDPSGLQVSGLSPRVSPAATLPSALDVGPSTFDRARLARAALRLASDATAPDSARTTALQLCGQLQLADVRPLALEIARSPQAGVPLRIAAVATLGDLGGDAATRDYIAALVTGPERRLRVPAESALKRFSIN